ncbi:putative complex I intermediate-associated protein 30, mitochondrial [[Candida] railenensis]|uniref:Complex I intermediate-associated protein 30, mitochondrial n=1 Tax=[Candida] railenensis TaxID=45579 RepID=A0A9P0VXJ8_9ASCO|nr:putative complex I intermediate-associated protein 30, mitochondrial [[Candida] railenensis]
MSLRTLGLNSPLKGLFTRPTEMTKTVQTILDFKNAPDASFNSIITRCDKELGGFSSVNFDLDPQHNNGVFHGYLNLDLPKDRPDVTRSGYAMFRTKDQQESWLSGDSYWDWSQFSSLVLRVKGDRRKYLVNIQANTPLITDLFQHRLFLNTPGEWETVVIPLNDFVMTNWGVIQDGCEMNKSEIKTVGVGLLDKQYGPFALNVDWIKVMTGTEVERETQKSRIERVAISTPLDSENVESDIPTEHGSALNTKQYEEPKATVF